ncbi:transcription factor tfiiib component [Ophiocordyceps camponoti-floridani]|uniref:Transcription factor tfiiib component n=1 Tax=Ophiocordyceps camponoti-floridani TaxID=2030778 RepID=A0A8H4VAW0_9HYPO|nr:transcription factor tfiiib component [Ophiocordyceps camponoti-floridani]
MSSMLKKKGGLAFKPKIPSARSRPAIAPLAPSPKSTASQSLVDPALETASVAANSSKDVIQSPVNIPSIDPPTGQVGAEQSSHTASEPSQSTVERPGPEPPSQSTPISRNDIPEISETVESGVVQAGGSTQHTADIDTRVDPVLDPPTTVSSSSPPEPQSESPAERRPSETAAPETSSYTPIDEAPSVPASDPASGPSNESASGPSIESAKPASSAKKPTRKPGKSKAKKQDDNPPKKRQRKKAANEGGTTTTTTTTTTRSRRRKRKADAQTEDGTEPKKKKGRARSVTPEDAEDQVVDLQQLKMADLTKDLRIGKKFSRHDELRERERLARSKTKNPQQDGEPTTTGADPSSSTSPNPDGPQDASPAENASSSSATAATSGPQFRIVDGQIVVDQNSLVMDRHARAAAAQARGDMETVEENDFTRLITSSSFMTTSKLKGPNIWTADETELFYRGLRMFGTEFEMISKMFPGKQRRHVKLKFNREERHNPKRIDAALIGEKTTKMDIDEYRAFTGAVYESVEAIEAEQRKIGERYELERQRIADEQAETMRKKREALFADDHDNANNNNNNNHNNNDANDANDANAIDGGRKKRAGNRRKAKQTVAYGLNGEPINQSR